MRLFGIAFLLLFVFVFFFSGALGFKKESDCGDYKLNNKWGELALCYNEVAVSYASVGNGPEAEGMCTKIWQLQTQTVYAVGQANLCFADIARILKDPTKCSLMIDSQYEEVVAGADITKKICEESAKTPSANDKPLCQVIFVLFPLLLFSLFRTAHKL